jgi:quinol monooxygenase YgiN
VADLTYIVVLRAQAGKADELGAALAHMVAMTSQEAGCSLIELNRSSEDPSIWMTYERWKNKEAFARHMEQPYTLQFIARMGDLTSEPADVRAFDYRG